MDDLDAVITDKPKDSFEYRLALMFHRGIVKSLLTAKQSDSFTTAEYIAFVEQDIAAKFPTLPRSPFPDEAARGCLTGFGVMREVEQDVWGLLT